MKIKIGYIHQRNEIPSWPVFVEIEETTTGFSLSGDYRGCSGQIDDEIRKAISEDRFEPLIPMAEITHMLDYWDKWHLNNLTAGCQHQEEEIQKLRVIKPELFGHWNYQEILAALQNPVCHICGYKYGTGWKTVLPPPKELKWIREFKARWEGKRLGRRL